MLYYINDEITTLVVAQKDFKSNWWKVLNLAAFLKMD